MKDQLALNIASRLEIAAKYESTTSGPNGIVQTTFDFDTRVLFGDTTTIQVPAAFGEDAARLRMYEYLVKHA